MFSACALKLNSAPAHWALGHAVGESTGGNGHGARQEAEDKQNTGNLLHCKTPFRDVGFVLICCGTELKKRGGVSCSVFGKWNKSMVLISALEDLLSRTLAAIPGLLGRLEYLSSLKVDGRYAHWGLSRVYGERGAQRAMADAHKTLVGEVLQTPLEALVEDSEAACAAQGQETAAYVEEIRKRRASLLPDTSVGVATTRHFSSVLSAISALTKAQSRATRPDA
jgi:hypothetical protein